MPEKPSVFAQHYKPITVHTLSGTQYINIDKYLSGEPRNKKFNKAAMYDLQRFLKKKGRYKSGDHGADRHTWDSKSGLFAFGLFGTGYFLPWLNINISELELNLGFYGKGKPATIRKILQVIDFYLHYADINLNNVYWGYIMDLQEYAEYYLGLDCNGFTGAYLETHYPHFGIDGGDHINYLDGKLKKRTDISKIKSGDILSREGSGGIRHVAMINSVGYAAPGAKSIQVTVTHSSGSKGGLGTQSYTLKKLSGSDKLNWHLAGYYKFNHLLGLEAK